MSAIDEINKMKDDFTEAKKGEPKTYVHMLLDDSVSMQSRRGAAIQMFNEQVDAVRDMCAGQSIKVSLIKFSSHVSDPLYWDADVLKLEKIDEAVYNPDGASTRLMDGIGVSIAKLNALSDIADDNVSVLFMIVTDGEENDSREFDKAKILDLIGAQEKTGRWTFTFLGASKESLAEAASIGIHAGNTIMAATAGDMMTVSCAAGANTRGYMADRKKGLRATTDYYAGNR